MVSACVFVVLFEHPSSPVHQSFESASMLRRALIGLAMGLTAIGIIYSPWGQRSGAHMNPAVTLTFLSLGKIAPWDALFYVVFQFLGGIAGVLVANFLIGSALQHSAVNYAVTVPVRVAPGSPSWPSSRSRCCMMSTILWVSNSRRLSRYHAAVCGRSGRHVHHVRSSAVRHEHESGPNVRICFPRRTNGRLCGSTSPHRPRPCCSRRCFTASGSGAHRVFCAKLHHCNNQRCIFNCRYGDLNAQ